jgi:hypothetical protein
VARSRNHCGHENATVLSRFIVVAVDIDVNNTKAMEMQQWVPFALLSSCKIFLAIVNSNKY